MIWSCSGAKNEPHPLLISGDRHATSIVAVMEVMEVSRWIRGTYKETDTHENLYVVGSRVVVSMSSLGSWGSLETITLAEA
jgi:hypothetical protein